MKPLLLSILFVSFLYRWGSASQTSGMYADIYTEEEIRRFQIGLQPEVVDEVYAILKKPNPKFWSMPSGMGDSQKPEELPQPTFKQVQDYILSKQFAPFLKRVFVGLESKEEKRMSALEKDVSEFLRVPSCDEE